MRSLESHVAEVEPALQKLCTDLNLPSFIVSWIKHVRSVPSACGGKCAQVSCMVARGPLLTD